MEKERPRGIFFRKGVPDDQPALLAFFRTLARGTGADAGWDEEYPGPEHVALDLATNSVSLACTLKQGREEILGTVTLLGEDCEPFDDFFGLPNWEGIGGRRCTGARLGIREDLQGTGLAKQLVSYALRDGMRRGYEVLLFFVESRNRRALRFYDKLGWFTPMGRASLWDEEWECFMMEMKDELKQDRQDLKKLQERLSAYEHALGLISYDGATTAPKGTASNRGHAISILSEELYNISTGEETVALLERLDAHKEDLTEWERREVYLLLKDIRFMQAIPLEEYLAYQELLVQADDVWHTAKETNDFPLFEPYLEKIFDANLKFAKYNAPEMDPYDYWLNEFEPGASKASCDAFFGALRESIVPLIKEIGEAKQVDTSFLKGSFPVPAQDKLSQWVMGVMGLDPDHVGLSTTEHPFTTSLGSHLDERITTHYFEDDFASSLYSVIHEGGHALYDTGSADTLAYSVLDGGVSMGIHESQSRFYENLLGRSRAFVGFLFPKLAELFPEALKGRTAEDLYRAINKVEPSLIRTEADEVTYCLHVMVRYELEKRIFAGELKVHDLPEAWNALYKEYLGVDVPDDTHGVLQDSHWSGGAIGYFPSYALGSAYGAQFLVKMKEEVDVESCLEAGDFAPINEWNRQHIWQFGCLYTPQELLDQTLKAPFDPQYYVDYLTKKYKEIYGL